MRYIVFLILFLGCITPKKVDKFLQKNPDFNARQCSGRFPIIQDTFVSILIDSILVPEVHNEILWDTLYVEGCPQIKPKVIVKTITITKERTDKLKALQTQKTKDSFDMALQQSKWVYLMKEQIKLNQNQEAKIKKYKDRNRWLWLIIIFVTIFAFRRQIAKLII